MTKKIKKIFLLVIISILSIYCVAPVSKAATGSNRVVRVGYYENEVFEEGASEGAIKNGYAYEYYRKLSEYTGWTYEYVYGDFYEVYQMLLDGEVDLVAGLARTEDRENIIGFPDQPMGAECYGLVKHTDDGAVINGPKSLNGRTIGVLDSAIVNVLKEYLDSNNVIAKVIPYKNYETLLGAFDRKEIDILAAEYDGTYDRNHAETLFSFGETDYYLGVNYNDPALLKELNQAQSLLLSEEPDYISSLRAKYYPVSLSSRAFSLKEKNWLVDHHKLTVGYLNDYLPYSDTDSNGNVNGIVKDIFPTIFKNLGVNSVEFEYVAYDNYKDMTKAVCNDEIDVAFPVGGGLFFTEEDGIYQSNPVISAITNLIYKSEYAGASSVDFAVNENNLMQYYYVKSHYPTYTIKLYPSIEACLDAVIKGEVKCTTLNGLRTNDILRNIKYDGLSFRQLQYNDDRCFGIKIGNDGLLKILNRGVNVMGKEYVINLTSSYSDELYTYTFKDFFRRNIWIMVFVMTGIAAAITFILLRDRARYNRQLRDKEKAQAALEKINHDKTVYLKNLSQDIRTPVNAINGLVDLLQHTDDEELRKKYLGFISFWGNQTLEIINDVLDFSSFETGKVVLSEHKTNIQDIVNNIRSVTSLGIAEKHQIFTVNYKNISHPIVITDKTRLTQALLNVLFNSISFTPNQGLINLSIEEIESSDPDRPTFEFRIKDNGIGISQEVKEVLFDPYRFEKDSVENGNKIVRLGVAITKKIVDLMDGDIAIYSNPGEGTECIISIPMKVSNEMGVTLDNDSEDKIDSYNFAGKRILLVESVPANQMLAGKLLKKAGFEIQIATDSFESFEKMQAAPAGYFDVIIINEQPFDETGFESVGLIRDMMDNAKANVPILAIFDQEQMDIKSKAIEAGINVVLTKPVEMPELLEAVRTILKF